MKCDMCNGSGEIPIVECGFPGKDECPQCHGKGYLNNEEYIRTCSTEELAEFLITVAFEKRFKERIHWYGYANMHSYKTEVLEWLKEKHNG